MDVELQHLCFEFLKELRPGAIFQWNYSMIYQVGNKQCSNSGRKRNDIDPLESDFMVQPPSLLEFPGPLTPPPPWNFQFPPWWGSGYFLELHIWDFCGYSLNTLKYPKMGICHFFPLLPCRVIEEPSNY